MNFNVDDTKCFFCQHKDSQEHLNGRGWFNNCPFCGYYMISDQARHEILCTCEYKKTMLIRNQIAMLLFERKSQGKGEIFLGTKELPEEGKTDYKKFLEGFPHDFRQQHDRALLNIARLARYTPLQNIESKVNDPRLLFCSSLEERDKLLELYKQEGFVDFASSAAPIRELGYKNFYLTIKGFEYACNLENDTNRKQLAFIAMWFNEEMNSYTEAVERAVRQAGYDPYIANRDSYNGLIMSKVMNKISESRFVIADLTSLPEQDLGTGVRGGVYFESGYAAGLKKEVILTCRDDVKDRIHFDLKQFFSIYWHDDNGVLKAWDFDFVEYLTQHIIKTVGKGPVKSGHLHNAFSAE